MASGHQNGEKYAPLVTEALERHNGKHGNHHHHHEHDDLEQHIADLEKRRRAASDRLEDFDRKWSYRRKFLAEELQEVLQQKANAELELETLSHEGSEHTPPVGPKVLLWIEGNLFHCLCTVIILLNVAVMFLEMSQTGDDGMSSLYVILDNIFLVWYIIELSLKTVLFQRALLIGKMSRVWFNWLDLAIVVCGIAEQWIAPLLEIGPSEHQVSPTYFRMLRLLRLVRIARIAKAVYVFVRLDLSWVEGEFFQSFIMGIICLNSLTMGLEVDVEWNGWYWMEQFFLVIYTFELSVRLKSQGFGFCGGGCSNAGFNIMDGIIVAGGMLDQWLIPLIRLVQKLAFDVHGDSKYDGDGIFFKLLRMMRLLRALRLIRLLRNIKPLFDLMTGIVEATQGVGWVLLLTLVILYAFAVTFTNLIGRGLIYGDEDEVPSQAKEAFGTVLTSMFNLFKLMNGDQDVVEPILNSTFVKLSFTGFMIIANWMVLAVLTSVVSDRMISTTQRHEHEENAKSAKEIYSQSISRLRTCLAEAGSYGSITWAQFDALLQNDMLMHELCHASGLSTTDLEELFIYTARDDVVDTEEYLVKLLSHSSSTTERSMFRLERYIHSVESRMEYRLDAVLDAMGVDQIRRTRSGFDNGGLTHEDEHRKIYRRITKRRLDERCGPSKYLSNSVWL